MVMLMMMTLFKRFLFLPHFYDFSLNEMSRSNSSFKTRLVRDESLNIGMHKDRDVSLNHLVRDFKRQSYAEDDDSDIKDVFLHVPCVDTNEYGKYLLRIDELVIKYTNNDSVYRYQIRYDPYCIDPDIDNTIIIGDDAREDEPFVRISCAQPTITKYIKRYPSTDSVTPFWMRVDLKQTPFKPNGTNKTVMFHKLTVADVNFD